MASITKRNGKWQYRVSYKDPETGKYRTKSKGGFTRKIDAQNEALELELEKNKNLNLSLQEILFSDYFINWAETYKMTNKSQSTINRYYYTAKIIEQYFSNKKLTDITRNDYQTFLNDFGKNRTLVTLAKYNSFIKSMVSDAIEEGILYRDFTKNVTLSAGKESRSNIDKFLEPKDYIKLINISYAKSGLSNISATMVYFDTQTGMRYEEIAALSWNNVNFEDLSIKIDRAYSLNDTNHFHTTKTPSAKRTIPVSKECMDVLKNLKIEQEIYFNSKNYVDPENLVFRSRQGTIVSSSSLNEMLKTLLESAGINKMINFHDIRHTHISYLIDMGINPQYVSRRAGHKDLKTTYKYYTHLFDETTKKESESLQNLFDRINK